MQVILLAAGQSTRLQPISDKNVLEFSGKPLIEHQVAALKAAKMRDIVVVGGAHNIETLKTILKSYKNVAVVEQEKLEDGMAGGVLAGAAKVKHDNILVMSTNDVVDPSLFEDVIKASKSADDGLIVGAKVENYFPGGYLVTDKKGYVTEVVEKPGEGKEPSNWVNIVMHVFNDFDAFVKLLKEAKGKADGRYEKALTQYIKKSKAKLKMHKYLSYWQPIKFPWHVLEVMKHFLEQQGHKKPKIHKSAKVAKTALVEGNVEIAAGAQILHNAHVRGPAYIGENVVVGNNAFVRQSMVGNDCIIGFATEVTRSYLNHDVWTHGTYVGDSIVDSNVSFGSGTVLANLRFDENNIKVNVKGKRVDTGTHKFGSVIGSGTRFGVNSSVNPGIKIGQNCFIGGGLIVDQNIEDNKVVVIDQKLKIVGNKKSVDASERKKV